MDIEILDPVKTDESLKQRLLDVENLLNFNKAENICIINLEGKTDFAKFMVIATALSSKHAGSLAQKTIDFFKEQDCDYVSVEGMQEANWVLVDSLDIVVHIFRPEYRDHYKLEKMWQN